MLPWCSAEGKDSRVGGSVAGTTNAVDAAGAVLTRRKMGSGYAGFRKCPYGFAEGIECF